MVQWPPEPCSEGGRGYLVPCPRRGAMGTRRELVPVPWRLQSRTWEERGQDVRLGAGVGGWGGGTGTVDDTEAEWGHKIPGTERGEGTATGHDALGGNIGAGLGGWEDAGAGWHQGEEIPEQGKRLGVAPGQNRNTGGDMSRTPEGRTRAQERALKESCRLRAPAAPRDEGTSHPRFLPSPFTGRGAGSPTGPGA